MSESDLAFLSANLPWLIAIFVATLLGTSSSANTTASPGS
jgi:hypothetical protein